MDIKIGIVLLLVSGTVIEAVPSLTIQPAVPNTGSTLTLTCELAGFTNDLMNFKKDGTTVYNCAFGGTPCNDNGGLSDYSDVDWSQTSKGIITISNADQTRDDGDWTCTVGSDMSAAVTLAITDPNCGNPTKPTNGQVTFTTTNYQSTATYSCDSGYTIDGTATTTCQADGTWSGSVLTCTVSQAGCLAPVIICLICSIYGTLWILAIVVLLVIYCTDQKRLPWNFCCGCCDGLLKNRWIWLLLCIVVPYVVIVVAIWLITKRPGKPTNPVISPKSVSVNVGDKATFTCTSSSTTYQAESGPTMSYTWRRNTVDMKSEGPYMVCGQTLIVTKVVKENAFDTFTCIAREENGPPSDESDSPIIVIIGKPTKPVISPKSVSVNVGDTATFTCTSCSTTFPEQLGLTMSYTWRRNTVDMKSEGPYKVCGQTLKVTKVVKENASDTFTCIVREENGPPSDESDSARIVIIAKPTWWTKLGNYGESEQSMPLLPFNE